MKWAATGSDIDAPVFSNVTVENPATTEVGFDGGQFVGTLSPVALPVGTRSNLFLGTANKLYWPNGGNKTGDTDNYYLGSCRAYFHIDESNGGQADVRAFVLNFGEEGEAQGITTTDYTDFTDKAGAWYTIDGVKLDGKPTKKGLYIHGGKKVVVP